VKPSRALAKRRLACENSQFFVYFDDLSHQGQQAQDYLVVAPKQVTGDLVTGVAVLPIVDGKFGLLRVYRHAVQNSSWEIPRGFIEPGESEAVSALRELTEETGLSCDINDTHSLGFVTPDAGVLAARVHLYAAQHCLRSESYAPLELGHQEFCLFSRSEINALIARSEIQDPCTLIAYFKYVNL
jgi:ADP-ribose pyrophosphatase